MNDTLDNSRLNKIVLKPRFKIEIDEDKELIIGKFKNKFAQGGSQFSGKIVDHHVIIDVNQKEQHFWSPQLHVEIEENEENTTLVKGLFGPKPTVWSLFMFIHFGVAVAFIVFLVIAYTHWSLEQDYLTAAIVCLSMPVLWLLLYFLGRIGRKKGSEQMHGLRDYFFKILEN